MYKLAPLSATSLLPPSPTRSSRSARRRIFRVFNKSSGGKKAIGLVRVDAFGDELGSSLLPPLMVVPYSKNKGTSSTNQAHVTCLSNVTEGLKGQGELLTNLYNSSFLSAGAANPFEASPSSLNLGKMSLPSPLYTSQGASSLGNIQYPVVSLVQLLESNVYGMKQSYNTEREMLSASQESGLTSDMNPEIPSVVLNNEMGRHSFEGQEDPSTFARPLNLDGCLWN